MLDKIFTILAVFLLLLVGISLFGLVNKFQEPTTLGVFNSAVAKAQVKFNYCSWNCEPNHLVDFSDAKDCLLNCIKSNEWEETNGIGSWLYE